MEILDSGIVLKSFSLAFSFCNFSHASIDRKRLIESMTEDGYTRKAVALKTENKPAFNQVQEKNDPLFLSRLMIEKKKSFLFILGLAKGISFSLKFVF